MTAVIVRTFFWSKCKLGFSGSKPAKAGSTQWRCWFPVPWATPPNWGPTQPRIVLHSSASASCTGHTKLKLCCCSKSPGWYEILLLVALTGIRYCPFLHIGCSHRSIINWSWTWSATGGKHLELKRVGLKRLSQVVSLGVREVLWWRHPEFWWHWGETMYIHKYIYIYVYTHISHIYTYT